MSPFDQFFQKRSLLFGALFLVLLSVVVAYQNIENQKSFQANLLNYNSSLGGGVAAENLTGTYDADEVTSPGAEHVQEYARGEVLIKFKDAAAEELRLLLKTSVTEAISRFDFLIKINPDYKVKNVRSIFDIERRGGESGKQSLLREQKSAHGRFPQRAQRAKRIQNIPNLSAIYRIEFEDMTLNPRVLAADFLKKYPNVLEYAEPNFIVQTLIIPNDTFVDPDQNGTWSTGAWQQLYEDLWGLKKIEADKAWDAETGSRNVIAAVIDTGLDRNHEDIVGNVWVNPGEDINHNGVIDGSGVCTPTPPDAPRDLIATAVSAARLDLSWVDTSNNETGFGIERKTETSGTYSQRAVTGVNVSTFSDTLVSGETTYFYRVYAYNNGGNSAYSNEASATTPFSPPPPPPPATSTQILIPSTTNVDSTDGPSTQSASTVTTSANDYDCVDNDGNGKVDDLWGWDFVSRDNSPQDGNGHGTHVAGTIGATGNNSTGVAGVNWAVKIMPVQGLGSNGVGLISNIANAVRYAADNGADVINNSWGGGGGFSRTLKDAFDYAYGLGAISVAAAGNSNSDVGSEGNCFFFPACLSNVIAVSASNYLDEKASFSNYGGKVEVAAPGVDILSLRAAGTNLGKVVQTKYTRLDGTSMASPHAAGLAALLLAQHPTLTQDEVRAIMKFSVDDIITPGVDLYSGEGRLNTRKALELSDQSLTKPELVLRPTMWGTVQIPIKTPTPIGVEIKNEGFVAAYNVDVAFEENGAQVGNQTIPELAPGATQVINHKVKYLTPEEKELNAAVDFSNQTSEFTEHNNRYTMPIKSIPYLIKEQAISTLPANQIRPDVSGDKIVWEDGRSGNMDIYLYDLKTSTEKRITTNDKYQIKANVSRNKIVWSDYRNGGAFYQDIYLYDLDTDVEKRITTNPEDDFDADIDGDRIVYKSIRPTGTVRYSYIYLYDLKTDQEIRITQNGYSEDPRISGEKVVYQDYQRDAGDIYLYDLTTGQRTPIAVSFGTQSEPDIFGDKIVWMDSRSGNYDIYMYDLISHQEVRITDDPANQAFPRIWGDRIVWTDYRNGIDIYMYDLANKQHIQITDNFYDQWLPAISDDRIVWTDNRNSRSGDIYMAALLSPNQAPVLSPIGNKEIFKTTLLEITVEATDSNEDPIIFTVSNLPQGAVFTNYGNGTGKFSWTPSRLQTGVYTVTFAASDGELSDSETITITVKNHPPILVPIGQKTIGTGSLLRFVVTGYDPDGDGITFHTANLPRGATFLLIRKPELPLVITESTYVFRWAPGNNQGGEHLITFFIRDDDLVTPMEVSETVEVIVFPRAVTP